MNGAASCPELASRQHIRDICGVVERALDDAGTAWRDLGADRRDPGARPRRLAAGRRLVRQGRRGRGRSAARRRSSSRRPHRVARAAERRAAAARGRPRRLGRAHEPVSRRPSRARTSCSAAHETMPRARPTTRSRSSWASAIRAARSIDRLAQSGNDRAVALPTTRLTHADRNAPELKGDLDFSFSGLKTAVLRHVRARDRRRCRIRRSPTSARASSGSSSPRSSTARSTRRGGIRPGASASPAACPRTAGCAPN